VRTWRRPGWLHRRIAATNQTKARTRRLAQNLIYVTIDLYLFGVFFTIFVVSKRIYVTRHFGTSLSMEAQMGMTSLGGQNLNAHAIMQLKGTLSIILHDA